MEKEFTAKVKIISIEELRFEELIWNYFSDGKIEYFCIVEKDGSYIGTISSTIVKSSMNMYEIEYWLKTNNAQNIVRLNRETIIEISKLYRTIGICELEIPVVQNVSDNQKDIQNTYALTCEKLSQAGVTVIKVKIPTLKEITNEKQKHKLFNLYPSDRCFYSYEARSIINPILSKISDDSYDNLKEYFFMKTQKEYHDKYSKNRIFFVGPCIVSDGIETAKNTIRNICRIELQKKGLQAEIITIPVFRNKPDDIYELESYNLTNHDIVIIIEETDIIPKQASYNDIDITPLFNSYSGDKWLYYDIAIHTTVYGNRLIANKIMERILPVLNKMKDMDKKILLHKIEFKIQMKNQEDLAIKEFLNNCKNEISKYEKCGNIGAIVMNANPFTNEHKYLVETAIKQVDLLIIFVVEEDASYIPFNNRIQLVKEGVKDLYNIIVIPSGRFIISKSTFKNYFEKEVLQSSSIDASTDIHIFGKQIAKELHITRRFVGEEPIDQVTKQYNEQMKEQLPNYGVELVEIPRITLGDNIISASYVRELLKTASWEKLRHYVPISTYEYLIHNREFLERRKVCEKSISERMKLKNINKRFLASVSNMPDLLKLIHKNDKVAIYGLGIDAMMLLKEVPENDMSHIKFFDQRAGGYCFFGQEVIEPKKLLTEYSEYKIIITSRQYGMEMYNFLRKIGVSLERVFFVCGTDLITNS